MARVNIGGKRMVLSAEVPDPVADLLRKTRQMVRSLSPATPSSLNFGETLPDLQAVRRDPNEAIAFLPAVRTTPAPTDPSADGTSTAETGALARQVASTWWYHTIELPDGTVTPGYYDHRPLVPRYGLPADLKGKRALDVATFDGFWAFELERRGADVVASDLARMSELDLPPQAKDILLAKGMDRETGEGFKLAHAALNSRVERVLCDVYDLDPGRVGTFDFIHVADLLLHLEKPLAALRAIRSVATGTALIVDCFDPAVPSGSTRYLGGWSGAVWWMPSLDTLAQMVLDAGFSDVKLHLVYALGNAERPDGLWRAVLLAQV